MAALQELQDRALELFKSDYSTRLKLNEKRGRAKTDWDAAVKSEKTASQEFEAAQSDWKEQEDGAPAKKLGLALLAVKDAMPQGEFTNWARENFKQPNANAGLNRVNYCIRVAEGKESKEARSAKKLATAKKFPHKPVIEKVTKELNQLVHLLATGKKENADELMAKIIDEVKALYKSTQEHCKQIVEERKALQAQIAEADKKAESTRKLLVKKEREIRSNFSAPRAKGASTSA